MTTTVNVVKPAQNCFMCGTSLAKLETLWHCRQCGVSVCSEYCLVAHQAEVEMTARPTHGPS